MKPLTKITLLIASPIPLLIFIFYKADLPNRTDNGFTRSFIPEFPAAIKSVYLGPEAKGIIGGHDGEILLSTDRADRLIAVSTADGHHRSIPTISSDATFLAMARIKTFAMQVNGRNLYFFDYGRSSLYAIDTVDAQLKSTITMDFFCSAVAPLHPGSAILRGYSKAHAALLFGRITTTEDTLWERNISLPSLDGGLSTDGQLIYENGSDLLSYMHYYNNNIIIFDTMLNVRNTFTTLDTVSPKLRLDPDKPRLITNKTACVHRDVLYICSNLRADNETYPAYMKNIPVDTFDIRTGTYLGSFYLPVDNGKLIRNLRVINGLLYAFYFSGRLAVFSLPGTSS